MCIRDRLHIVCIKVHRGQHKSEMTVCFTSFITKSKFVFQTIARDLPHSVFCSQEENTLTGPMKTVDIYLSCEINRNYILH